MGALGRWSRRGLLLGPGALVAFLSFNSGGFFPEAPGVAAVVLATAVASGAALAERPFAGMGRWLVAAAGALALYALWTLASAAWSGSLARALIEFDRPLLYVLALGLFGSMRVSTAELGWMLRGVAVAVVAVCAAALITRLLPELWEISPELDDAELSYPLTYANALGLLAGLGAVICLHLASHVDETPGTRMLAAGSIPLLGTVIALTYSVAGAGAAAAGVLAYALLGRPRGLATAVLVSAPMAAVAALTARGAQQLAAGPRLDPAALADGRRVALIVAISAAIAALGRALLVPYDDRLHALVFGRRSLPLAAGACTAVLVALVAGLYLAARPAATAGAAPGTFVRDSGGLHDRPDQWDTALDGFRESPLVGQGAGTYELLSLDDHPRAGAVLDAHSLYLEALGELGVVGLLLLSAAVISLLAGSLAAARRRAPPAHAAVFAVALAWAAHAAVDWDWEMPAVTAAVFALGGALLGTASGAERLRGRSPWPIRALVAPVVLACAVVPGLVAVSQARLDRSIEAFMRGDCDGAAETAGSSLKALGARPEPHEVLGYCAAIEGSPHAPVELQKALDRDPDHPEYREGLAFVRALAERDPSSAFLAARQLQSLGRLGAQAIGRVRPPARGAP